jgi:tRNA-binding protein
VSGAGEPHRIDPDGLPYDPAGLDRKPDVGLAGFLALDLRVGRVTDVQPFPEARDPAWKLTVDFGPVVGELSTSAKVTNYPADELVGRTVVGAINLGAKRIAGFTSQFLVLGGLEPDGTVRLLAPDGDLTPGSVVA